MTSPSDRSIPLVGGYDLCPPAPEAFNRLKIVRLSGSSWSLRRPDKQAKAGAGVMVWAKYAPARW